MGIGHDVGAGAGPLPPLAPQAANAKVPTTRALAHNILFMRIWYRKKPEDALGASNPMRMETLLDGYLLEGRPAKPELIAALLQETAPANAGPYLEGLRLLRDRTPDLALVALRLTLAGKSASDAGVVGLRDLAERARKGDGEALQAYRAALA